MSWPPETPCDTGSERRGSEDGPDKPLGTGASTAGWFVDSPATGGSGEAVSLGERLADPEERFAARGFVSTPACEPELSCGTATSAATLSARSASKGD